MKASSYYVTERVFIRIFHILTRLPLQCEVQKQFRPNVTSIHQSHCKISTKTYKTVTLTGISVGSPRQMFQDLLFNNPRHLRSCYALVRKICSFSTFNYVYCFWHFCLFRIFGIPSVGHFHTGHFISSVLQHPIRHCEKHVRGWGGLWLSTVHHSATCWTFYRGTAWGKGNTHRTS